MVVRRRCALFVQMGVLAIVSFAIVGCAGGARPVLVDPQDAVPVDLGAELPPAPAGTSPLPAARADIVAQPAPEDALNVWTDDIGLAYTGSCVLGVQEGAFCHVEAGEGGVYYLGPSPDETYHIVTVSQITKSDSGRVVIEGYRVTDVRLAGR